MPLVGAWLGFNAMSAGFGMLAPLFAIVGAVVGANLSVLGLDIAWDLQAREHFAATGDRGPSRPAPAR